MLIRRLLAIALCTTASAASAQLQPEQRFLYPQDSDGYAVFDADADGDMDIVRSADGTLLLHEQLAPGSFRVVNVLGSCKAHDIRTADIDADGVVDIVAGDEAGDRICWAKGLGGGNYLPLQDLVSGTPNPYDVHMTDLDGDGDLDLLHADGAVSTGYRWNANLGAGSFGPSTLITSAAGASSDSPLGNFIAVGDVDLDGDADLAMAGPTFAWWENDGAGNFTVNTLPALPSTGAEPLFTDLDGDGFPDLVVTYAVNMATTGVVAALFNLGNATFGPLQVLKQISGSSYNTSLNGARAADVNGDGARDLIMSCELGPNISNGILTLINNGQGSFPTITDAFNAVAIQPFATGDVDGDGQDDVVSCSNRGPHVRFASNAPIAPLGSVAYPDRVIVLDANNDPYPDILTLCSISGWGWFNAEGDDPLPAGLHMNEGNGIVSDATLDIWTSRSPLCEVDAGDLDGDGDEDVVGAWTQPYISATTKLMLLRSSAGALDSIAQVGTPFSAVALFPRSPSLRDLDADGDLDLTWAYGSSDLVCTALNQGNGVFNAQQTWPASGTPITSTPCDIDGDGDADLVTTGVSQVDVHWLPNDGTAGFGADQPLGLPAIQFNWNVPLKSPVLHGVDLTNDRWEDIVVFTGDSIAVLLNNAGTWSTGQQFAAYATAYAVGDIDNSGSPDLVAIRSNREVVAWLNMGLGIFAPELLLADASINTGTDHITLADVDGDGLNDVITCSTNGHSAAWMRNGGNIGTAALEASPPVTGMHVFPVPAREELRVVTDRPLPSSSKVVVSDVQGRVIRTLRGNGTNTIMLDCGDLGAGVYVLRITVEGTAIAAARFVVE